MRNLILSLLSGAAIIGGARIAEQLADSTSTLRLNLAELHDRLREVTP